MWGEGKKRKNWAGTETKRWKPVVKKKKERRCVGGSSREKKGS